jgi:predicted AAA+ superfamily ATPase
MERVMIARNEYMENLRKCRDKQLIKVITGVRRCGKSTLMEMYRDHLLEDGISGDQIVFINFDDLRNEPLAEYRSLYDHVNGRIVGDKMNYVFLDEIQKVTDFQKAIASLFIKKNVDIYITGSNATMLSGELATLLSGRYIQIKMLPLSFREYAGFIGEGISADRKFIDYLNLSSFPYALELGPGRDSVRTYLESLYDTILLRGVASRRGQVNISALDSLAKFMLANIGNITSVRKISNTMKSLGRTMSTPTIESYLSSLSDAFLFYKAKRYDAKGKKYLQTNDKYYAVDVGLRNNILGHAKQDTSHALENVIYLELLRRGFDVYVGKVDEYEIDFVAMKGGIPEYYQVSETVKSKETLERELRPLVMVKDNNPKYLITMDMDDRTNIDGIIKMNAVDYLLNQQ